MDRKSNRFPVLALAAGFLFCVSMSLSAGPAKPTAARLTSAKVVTSKVEDRKIEKIQKKSDPAEMERQPKMRDHPELDLQLG